MNEKVQATFVSSRVTHNHVEGVGYFEGFARTAWTTSNILLRRTGIQTFLGISPTKESLIEPNVSSLGQFWYVPKTKSLLSPIVLYAWTLIRTSYPDRKLDVECLHAITIGYRYFLETDPDVDTSLSGTRVDGRPLVGVHVGRRAQYRPPETFRNGKNHATRAGMLLDTTFVVFA